MAIAVAAWSPVSICTRVQGEEEYNDPFQDADWEKQPGREERHKRGNIERRFELV